MAKQLNVNLAFNADTKQVKTQLQDLQNQLTKIMQMSSQKNGLSITKELQEATQAAASLKAHLDQATNVNTGKLDLGLLNKSFKDAGVTLDNYRVELQKLGPSGEQAFNTLASSILKAEVPLKQTSSLLHEFGTTLKNTARWQLSSSILHGFMGSLQHAYGYAQDLNESLNNIRIVTGNSVDQMAQFAVEANKAAQALSTTTTEYTNASLIYYQQGLSDEEVKERTDVTIKMANVARESAETVSDQMTAVWNNFYDGSKSLEYYADVMTALGAATASSTAEISEGLNKFAAVADTVGLSYEYATAALTTVTATTRQSADIVGNAFKTLFARIQGLNLGETLEDGTDLNKYSEALAAVGINIKDQAGEVKDMNTILDEMGAKWKTLAKDQQIALAQTVAGVRQYTQLVALMDNWDFFQQNLDTASGAEGALQKQADIYTESWEAARDRVTAAAEEIYSELLNDDFFIDLTKGFAGFLNLLNDTIDGIGGVQGTLVMLGNVISRVFAQDMAGSIDKFIYNLQNSQKIANQMRESALNSIANMTEGSDLGTAYENLAGPQEAYLRNAEKMSEVEKRTAEYLLGQHEARVQNLVELSQEKEKAEAIKQSELKRLKNQLLLNQASRGQTQYINNTVQSYEKVNQVANKTGIALNKAFSIDKSSPQGLKEIQKLFTEIDISGVKFSDDIQEAFNILRSGNGDAQQVAKALEVLNTALNTTGEAGSFDGVALDNLRKALSAVIPNGKVVENVINGITTATNDVTNTTHQFAETEREVGEESDNLQKKFDETKLKMMSTGDVVVSLAQGLSSFAMVLTSIKGLGNIWSDEDLSTGEKILSTLTTLGTVIPMLVMSYQGLSASQITVNKNSLTAIILNSGLVKSLFGVKAAEDAAAEGAVTFEGALAPLLVETLAITAAFAAIVAIGAGVVAIFKAVKDDAPADPIKEAAEEAEALAAQYENVKTALDELKQSLEDYNSARDALDEMVEGTQEWEKAVIDLNSQVLDLLDKYPQLAQYIDSSKGYLDITKAGQEEIIKTQYGYAQNAYQSNLMGQSRASKANTAESIDAFVNDGSIFLLANSTEKAVDAINDQGTAILENSDALMEAADISKKQAEALLQNRDGLISLAAEVKANTEANKLYAEQLGHSLLEEAKNDNIPIDEQFEDQLANLVGRTAKNMYDVGYGAAVAFGKNGLFFDQEKIQQDYAKLMGYEWRADLKDNKGEYLVNGEITEIDDKTARIALAQNAAQEEAIKGIQTYTAALQEVKDKSGETSSAILDLVAGIDQETDNLTKKDVEALKGFDLSTLSEETIKALNINPITFNKKKQEIEDDLNKALADIRVGIKIQDAGKIYDELDSKGVLDDVDVNGRKAVADTLNRAIALGSQDTVKLIQDAFDAPGVDAQEFADTLSNIDWSTTSVNDLRDSLKEAGVATNYTNAELQHLIDTMNLASDPLSILQEQYTAIQGIIDGLETGDTISPEDFFALGDAADGYFTQMMDGTYKLTGDAEEFYKLVQDQQIQKFKSGISELQEKNANLQNISGYDFDNLKQNAIFQYGEDRWDYDRTAVEQQIEIIKALGEQSEDTSIKVKGWKDQIDNLSKEDLQEIADAVADCQSQFENLDKTMASNQARMLQTEIAIASSYDNFSDLRQALEDGTIHLEAFNTAAVNLDKIKDIEDLDSEELSKFSQYLQDIADSSDDLADNMSDNASKIVAKSIMKMNDGIDELANNWENWSSILEDSQSSAEEYSEAMNGMRGAMANLLDISEEFIDADFIKDNMEDVKLAAEGDTEAIDRLKQALIDPVVAKIAVDNEVNETELMSQVTKLQSLLDEMGPIELGTEIDNTGFIDACNKMIADSKMTADQVNAMFDAMGFEATFASEGQTIQNTVPEYTTHHTIKNRRTTQMENGKTVETYDEVTSTEQTGEKPVSGEFQAYSFSTNGKVPKVKTLTKKATGSSNNYSSSNKGGTASPGGKSGSGGKEKSKETKDRKKADDELDRYWDINNAIKATNNRFEELSDEMKKTQTVADHLFGKALIANLKQQNEQLERENALVVQQRSNYQALYAEQRRELSELESKLSGFGAQFNGDALANYSSLLSGALAAYNAAIDAYNASAQEDTDKLALEAAEKQYTEIKETIDRYRTLYYTDMADTQDKLRDLEQQELENRLKILENNLKSWEVEIELKLNITEAKRKWDEFLKEVKQDFRKIYEDLTINSKFDRSDFFTYVDDVGTTLGAIRNVEAEMNKLKNGGSSDMFYDITEAQEKLKELQEKLIENGKSLTELYKQVWKNYISGLDQVQDKLGDIDKQYERIDDELEYEKELIELLYGDKAYALMDKYYKAQSKNILAQIDSMRTQVNFWQSEFNKAYQMNKDKHNVNLNDMSTWTEDMRKAYENMQDAQANLNDLILEGVKILHEEYLNAINEVIDTMDKNIWGMSLDDLKDNWDHIQKIADEYLDDIEGAYKIQTLANKIDQSIANTSSLQAQQKLQKLREEEIAMLREKENLTQDDIDLAEARYQIALKEIALEEAQQNKTSMKLTRDTSGNWTYQYVADEEDIMTKQQELLDAYNNLYQTADEAYAHAMELATNTYETMQEKIREIAEDMTLSEEEKMQRIQEIYDTYLPEIEAAVGNSELYRQEAMMATSAVFAEVCEQDEEAYDTLTNAQKEMVDAVRDNHLEDYEEIRAAIVDGVYPELNDAAKTTFEETNMNSKTAAADIITDWAKNNGSSVRSMVNAAINDMQKHIQNYEKELDNLQKIAGANFDKLGQMINKTSDKTDNLNDKTKQLCDDSAGYLSTLRSYVDEVAKAWDRVIAQIQTAKAELGDYLSLQFGGSSSGGSSGGSGNTGGGGSGSGSSGGASGGSSGGGKGYSSADVEGIAGNIWIYGDWGNNPTRNALMKQKFGDSNGDALYNAVQAKLNSGYGYNGGLEHDWDYYKKYGLDSYDTGGYTGTWDNTGRLAFLHQKELVLNADDTSNILKAVSAIRDLTSLNGSISSAIATSIGSMAMNLVANGGGNINTNSNSNAENQFYITAEFPNANDVETIREAILSLPNLASQYIHKNK